MIAMWISRLVLHKEQTKQHFKYEDYINYLIELINLGARNGSVGWVNSFPPPLFFPKGTPGQPKRPGHRRRWGSASGRGWPRRGSRGSRGGGRWCRRRGGWRWRRSKAPAHPTSSSPDQVCMTSCGPFILSVGWKLLEIKSSNVTLTTSNINFSYYI